MTGQTYTRVKAGQQSFAFARSGGAVQPPSARRRPRRGRIRIALKQFAMLVVLTSLPAFGWAWHQGHVQSWWDGVTAKTIALTVDAGFVLARVRASGQVRTPDEAILEALGVEAGDALFEMDMAALRGRIEALPWVGEAVLTRQFPDTLKVWIEERQPFVRWQVRGQLVVVDTGGKVIEGADAAEFINLPFIVGPGAPAAAADLLAVLASEPELAGRVVSAIRVGQRRWDLEFDNGMRLKLPEAAEDYGPAEAWQAFATMEAEKGVMNLQVATFDLRLSGRVVLRLTPEGKAAFENNDQKT